MPKLGERRLEAFLNRARAEQEQAVAREGKVVCDLRLASRRVRARVAGPALARDLLWALSERLVEDDGDPDVRIDACVAGALAWNHGDIRAGGLVNGSDPTGVLAIHETGSGVVTLIDTARAALHYRAPERLPWWERAAPLRIALYWALGGTGRHLLHAGAVGDERGAVLLAGAAHSGKTTVALAAADAGLGYLGDDHVLLDTSGGGHRAYSIYKTASIRGATETGEKALLDMAGRMRESLPVRAIVVPRVQGGTTRVRPVSGADALRALAPTTVLQTPFDDGGVLRVLAELVRGVPCFALDVGDDVGGIAGGVERVLELVR